MEPSFWNNSTSYYHMKTHINSQPSLWDLLIGIIKLLTYILYVQKAVTHSIQQLLLYKNGTPLPEHTAQLFPVL